MQGIVDSVEIEINHLNFKHRQITVTQKNVRCLSRDLCLIVRKSIVIVEFLNVSKCLQKVGVPQNSYDLQIAGQRMYSTLEAVTFHWQCIICIRYIMRVTLRQQLKTK